MADFVLKYAGTAAHVRAGIMSSQLFSMLGAKPVVGRDFFDDEDTQAGVHAAFPVILSHALWTKNFSANAGVIGSSVSLDGTLYTIVGVMPPDFEFPQTNTEMWIPLHLNQRSTESVLAVAQIKPGLTIAQVQSAMDLVASQVQRQAGVRRQLHGVHRRGGARAHGGARLPHDA